MKKTKLLSSENLPETYAELVTIYPPRPLHDKFDYENACEVINALAIWEEGRLNKDQVDYLDVISLLVEAYDKEHFTMDTSQYRGLNALKSLVKD